MGILEGLADLTSLMKLVPIPVNTHERPMGIMANTAGWCTSNIQYTAIRRNT